MDETARAVSASSSGARPRDSKQRFSDRVENYVRYRPGYPSAMLDFLADQTGLKPGAAIADVGSGTGILSQMLLERGYRVFGIAQPRNRLAGDRLLSADRNFHGIDGTAEATTLPDTSVDVITAAQAFHWFDLNAARLEFRRILRPGCRIALIWNRRKVVGSPFLEEYERLLLRLATDYHLIRHENVDAARLDDFFGRGGWLEASFPNQQSFDYDGLRGRLLSSSYVPLPGTAGHDEMMLVIRELFDRYNDAGRVIFEYDTEIYLGKVHAP